MKKSMYSLILSDDVVSEIDRLAAAGGTNRSGLVDRILAEYCSVVTPAIHMERVFDRVFAMLEGSVFLPARVANSGVMSIRKNLDFKYHPTVRYDIKLTAGDDFFGVLRVGLRSQNPAILRVLGGFFSLFVNCERKALGIKKEGAYSFEDGKFKRLLFFPGREATAEQLADAINEYVRMLDAMLNAYFAGAYDTEEEFARDFSARAARLPLII